MTNPVELLARHVSRTEYGDLPEAAVRATKTFLLDTLGVAVAGSGEPWGRKLAGMVAGWGSGNEATLWVHGTRLPAAGAAMANAYFIHCLEYDCVHEDAVVHTMATLIPAVIAQAERQSGTLGKVDGKRLLLAIAVGVDVAATIGQASAGKLRFFRPATVGAFGATAGACKVAGLDAETTVRALGAVYGQISGTLQPHLEGSPLLAMQMAFNTRAALTALDLARAGLATPRDVLLGPYGYFNLFEDGKPQIEAGVAELGKVWHVTRISHKPYSAGRLAHGAIGGILQLQAQHGFAAGEVERVLLQVPPLVYRLVGRPDVPEPSANYARLCTSFVAATALLYGDVDVPHYAPDKLVDTKVHEMAARVEVVADKNPDENAMVPQLVRIVLKDGATHETRLEHLPGHPKAALTAAENQDKFRRCWGYGALPLKPEVGDGLIARIEDLENLDDIRELVACMVA